MKFTKKFKENAALVVLGVVLFWGLTNYDKFFRLLGVMIGVLKPVIFWLYNRIYPECANVRH